MSRLLGELASDEKISWVLVAGEPCLTPTGLVDGFGEVTDERVATISFLSNAAGPLSFPFAGTPVPWMLGGCSADTATQRLRRNGRTSGERKRCRRHTLPPHSKTLARPQTAQAKRPVP